MIKSAIFKGRFTWPGIRWRYEFVRANGEHIIKYDLVDCWEFGLLQGFLKGAEERCRNYVNGDDLVDKETGERCIDRAERMIWKLGIDLIEEHRQCYGWQHPGHWPADMFSHLISLRVFPEHEDDPVELPLAMDMTVVCDELLLPLQVRDPRSAAFHVLDRKAA